jgi:acetyl esterase
MFYHFFKKQFIEIWKEVEKEDIKRIASQTFPKGVYKYTYTYLDDGSLFHEFNLYKPSVKPKEKIKLIIDIHGGGRAYGTKDLNDNFCFHLAKEGYVVLSPSYRLLTQKGVQLVNMVQDLFAFLNYILKNATDLDISFDDVLLTGDSAGGHLALLIATINSNQKLADIYHVKRLPIKFSGLTLNHPAPFLNEIGTIKDHKFLSIIERYGFRRLAFGSLYRFSPVYRNSSADQILKGSELPPILIVTSRGDTSFFSQSLRLDQLLRSENVPHTMYIEKNESCGHVFNISYPDTEEAKACNFEILEFYSENFK